MGLFNKKEEIPKIPTAATLPKLPEIEKTSEVKNSLPELPSFPSNLKNENINQELVKSAVTDIPSPGEDEVHVEIPEGVQVKGGQERESAIPPKSSMESSISDLPRADLPKRALEIAPSASTESSSKEVEPIFVRIDKFQAAQKNFGHIKDKVKDIESILKKIKDVKLQEEVELKGWAEDVEKIKSRLAEVDTDIFNQI